MPPKHDEQMNDENLRLAVIQALSEDTLTAELDVRVGVFDAIVHIAGSAPSLASWQHAERVALQVPGVRGVVNRIEAPGAPSPARMIDLNLNPNQAKED